MLYLNVHFRVQFKEPLKMHKKERKRTHWMLDLMVHLSFVIAIEDANEGSSEGSAKVVPGDLYTDAEEGAVEVETKGALEVTIELHLKMRMVVQMSRHRSAQNDSMKS